MARETICWKCKKACGKCSWSSRLEPVEGWDATPTKVVDSASGRRIVTDTFKVNHCPEFVEGR